SWQWFGNPLDAPRLARGIVHVDDRALQQHALLGDLKPLGSVGNEAFDDRLNLPPQHAFVRPGETSVTQECSAAWKDLFVGRLHVSMGPNHGADLSVEKTAQGDLL